MRQLALAFVGFALLGGCAHSTPRGSAMFAYGTADAALDCAEQALSDVGFQVQGPDIGAGSYQRMVPVRRAEDLVARNESPLSGTTAYVRVFASLADSTPSYKLRTFGFSYAVNNSGATGVLHETGVAAVVTRCGAARTSATLERPRN